MKRLMDAAGIDGAIGGIAGRVLADGILRREREEGLVLVGIRSRGELIAQRLGEELRKREAGLKVDVGVLDITMYRDDLGSRREITIPRGTEMDFRLDGRGVVLCDDVLETGRSVRAALDALVDFGRPRVIRLAVLIDRGRREFPIAGDFVGMVVDAPKVEQKVIVRLRPTDGEDAVYFEGGAES